MIERKKMHLHKMTYMYMVTPYHKNLGPWGYVIYNFGKRFICNPCYNLSFSYPCPSVDTKTPTRLGILPLGTYSSLVFNNDHLQYLSIIKSVKY